MDSPGDGEEMKPTEPIAIPLVDTEPEKDQGDPMHSEDIEPEKEKGGSIVGSPLEGNFDLVRAAETHPLPIFEDENGEFAEVQVPFHLLPGEGIRQLGRSADFSLIALTNYRLHVTQSSKSFLVNVPLGLIDSVEVRDVDEIYVLCKDAKVYRISLDDKVEFWTKMLTDAIKGPAKAEHNYAFVHYAWGREKGYEDMYKPSSSRCPMTARMDIERLNFNLEKIWRICDANKGYELCPTYPEELLVPQSVTNADLEMSAGFRSARRFPSIVWRHVKTGAVLARCSQPEVGWLGWRSKEDEKLVQAIAEACSVDTGYLSSSSSGADNSNGSINDDSSIKDLGTDLMGDIKKVLIMDCRSYAAAYANRARGGGVECEEYYPNADIHFMNLANIHKIRNSFIAVRSLLSFPTDSSTWLSSMEHTKWLYYISLLLKAAVTAATALDQEGRPVIVHCSDGWDRTPQITSLAQLCLDPFYRTFEGFRILVEREWLSFGHKMADRCGNAFYLQDGNERSPIFLQWLDCVHQLVHQFPCHFEFNLTYLNKLGQHTYSSLFGNFMCNSIAQRETNHIKEKTRSIWDYFDLHHDALSNYIYDSASEETVIFPRHDIKDLIFWADMYVSDQGSQPPSVNGIIAPKSDTESAENSRDGSENGEQQQQQADEIPELDQKLQIQDSEDGKAITVNDELSDNLPSDSKKFQVNLSTANGEIANSTDTLVPEKDERANKIVSTKEDASDEDTINPDKQNGFLTNGTQRASDREGVTKEKLIQLNMPLFKPNKSPIDSDGLLVHQDRVQQRVREMLLRQRHELQTLRRDLYYTRKALSKTNNSNGVVDGAQQGDESLLLHRWEEDSSGVQTGSTASDVSSWDAVDEKEAKTTLWVPDHALECCMKCQVSFWFGRRKHHCRYCGGLFCHDCSNNFVPIPKEQLYHPVRVCTECYEKFEHKKSEQARDEPETAAAESEDSEETKQPEVAADNEDSAK